MDHCPEFSYGEHGKPYLKECPGIHFNISHCRKGIACVVADRPVGVDIEEMQYDALLAQTVLNPEECSAVEMSDIMPQMKGIASNDFASLERLLPGEWKKTHPESHSMVHHTTEAEHVTAILKSRAKRNAIEKEASKEESK